LTSNPFCKVFKKTVFKIVVENNGKWSTRKVYNFQQATNFERQQSPTARNTNRGPLWRHYELNFPKHYINAMKQISFCDVCAREEILNFIL